MRLFNLVRTEDVSGVSGVGVVAEGVEFDRGATAVIRWRNYHSLGVFANIEQLLKIHGHNGLTKVEWL